MVAAFANDSCFSLVSDPTADVSLFCFFSFLFFFFLDEPYHCPHYSRCSFIFTELAQLLLLILIVFLRITSRA